MPAAAAGAAVAAETAPMLPLKFVPLNVFKGKQEHKIVAATKACDGGDKIENVRRGGRKRPQGWPSSASPAYLPPSLTHSLSPISFDFNHFLRPRGGGGSSTT